MEATELDVQLEELEVRLERLRALYEQYFLGIEKLEPTVARKDVDRRIYVLRREKIRNTGKRFKLQTIIQRYNTFQQYWHRICREIENGTYRRHVLRAERNFGPNELLTIAARKRFGKQPPAGASEPEASEAPASEPVAPPEPAVASPPPPAASPAVASAPSPPAPAPAPARRAPLKPQQFESLDLDMDFLGDWDPGGAAKAAPPKAATPVEPVKPSEPPAASRARSPAPIPVRASPSVPAAAPARAPASPPPPAAPAQAAASAAVKSVPPSSPPASIKSGPTPIPVRAPRKPLPRAEPKPPVAAKPVTPKELDESRIRELHGRLNELKRQNREAGQVSLEGLTKSLRATEEKLRKQHAGRSIDFDIVVKDGRTVVKPIVR